jgi:hypothetical protein
VFIFNVGANPCVRPVLKTPDSLIQAVITKGRHMGLPLHFVWYSGIGLVVFIWCSDMGFVVYLVQRYGIRGSIFTTMQVVNIEPQYKM